MPLRLAIKEQRGISSDAIFDMAPDEATEESKRKQIVKWDRKDMKYKKHNKEKLKIDTKLYLSKLVTASLSSSSPPYSVLHPLPFLLLLSSSPAVLSTCFL